MYFFIRFSRLRFSAYFFTLPTLPRFSASFFYTFYVLFLFFMFVISTVFSLTHPLVLCNTFEYNFYSIFYNILLFQSVIPVNYICCKIYNICVVFTVYFSLYDPLLRFFSHINLCPAKPYHMKNLTTQPCHTKSLTTQNIVEQKPYRAKIMPYEKSYHPKTMLHEKLHHAKYRCTKLHHAKYHYAKILQQKKYHHIMYFQLSIKN